MSQVIEKLDLGKVAPPAQIVKEAAAPPIAEEPTGDAREGVSKETEEDESDDENEGGNEENERDDETEAMQPLSMYFPPTEYMKKLRISTRCYVNEFLSTIDKMDPPLTETEEKWFLTHPQFRHIFHLPKDKNHKLMGMWMLLLRTACIEKQKEVWFVVNGVPVRYGLREHALISGLNCKNYPLNYKELGGKNFVRRQFGGSKVRYEDVKKKLEGDMLPSPDRLKMLVLYFLCSIIIGQTKCGNDATPVVDFFQRAVDDLDLCKTFPWGRLCFDHMLGEISHTMDKFQGFVNDDKTWPIPGFCIPLELLAFEAIPKLGSSFRVAIVDANDDCPRMCKSRFKKNSMRGFPLSEIYEELGENKDIHSILPASDEEVELLAEIFEADYVDDLDDPVVDSWMKRLKGGKKVYFEEKFIEDKSARGEKEKEAEKEGHTATETSEGGSGANELLELFLGMKKDMEEEFKLINDKFDGLANRFAPVETYVREKIADEAAAQRGKGWENNQSHGEPQVAENLMQRKRKADSDGDLAKRLVI